MLYPSEPRRSASRPVPPPAPPGLSLAAKADGEDVILTVHGEVDLVTVAKLERGLVLAEAIGGSCVRVDLDGLLFIDSCAVQAFIDAGRRLDAKGRELTLHGGPRQVGRVLDIAGLEHEGGVAG